MASKRRHSQDDSGYIWFKDTSGEGALNLAWDLGSYISETDKEAGHGKSLRKWVEVTIKTTDGKTIKGDRFVLATGSQIAMPPVPGLDQVSFKTSDEVLELTEVPNEVVVLGGGIVACELAQFLQRVGSKVTLLQRSEGILRDFPQRASDCIRNKFTEEGMIVKTGVSIEGMEEARDQTIRVVYRHKGVKESIDTQFLFHALGRKPATDRLNLKEIGVELQESGHVQTNSFQQTSISHIYAAGDCAGPHEIVHVAIRRPWEIHSDGSQARIRRRACRKIHRSGSRGGMRGQRRGRTDSNLVHCRLPQGDGAPIGEGGLVPPDFVRNLDLPIGGSG